MHPCTQARTPMHIYSSSQAISQMKSAVRGCLQKVMRGSVSLPGLKSSGGHLKLQAFSKTQMQANCKITASAGLILVGTCWEMVFPQHLGRGERSLLAFLSFSSCTFFYIHLSFPSDRHTVQAPSDLESRSASCAS